ncbi:hypothetical protein [Flavobacterium sp.]|uniref:hypothetical protein n=1 Tax=Flavobacterium sp. TaxID=239 RepID=UPI004047787D
MNNVRSILIGYDFKISILLSVILYFILPDYLLMKFMITYYNIVITVVSIIFSLLFTACSILMSSSDDDFIIFLNEDKIFDDLLWTFKVTLIALFGCLIYSLFLYILTNYYIENSKIREIWFQHKIIFCSLTLLTTYSLIATYFSVENTLIFSKFRSKYLKIRKSSDDKLKQK